LRVSSNSSQQALKLGPRCLFFRWFEGGVEKNGQVPSTLAEMKKRFVKKILIHTYSSSGQNSAPYVELSFSTQQPFAHGSKHSRNIKVPALFRKLRGVWFTVL
jgi:hypothetical protein